MNYASDDLVLKSALDRGRKSVRDGTVGNPYPPNSAAYNQFERGIEVESQLRNAEGKPRNLFIRAVA